MRDDNTNPVVRRIAVKADCVLTSPAVIGAGFSDNTDYDVLRREDGKPFLPGSTVAGVLRSLAPDAETEALFGVNGKMSPLWVYDAELEGDIISLDGVTINYDNKAAVEQRKFDFEAVATGAAFTFRALLTVRQNDSASDFDSALQKLIGVLKSGSVAVGAKTSRGFGRVKCFGARERRFNLSPGNAGAPGELRYPGAQSPRDALREWIAFDWFDPQGDGGFTEASGVSVAQERETLRVKLALDGSIMIRDTRNIYEDLHPNEKEPDIKHKSIGGNPVILGTSWAGAARSGLYRLLSENIAFGKLHTRRYFDGVFGYVAESGGASDEVEVSGSKSASSVVFGASIIERKDARTEGYRSVTRVKIDRFTGGAADGALFTEKPWFGGETELDISYPKNRADIRELMILALSAIDNGLIRVGGETGIGRGFFKVLSVNGESLGSVASEPKNNLLAALKNINEAGEAK